MFYSYLVFEISKWKILGSKSFNQDNLKGFIVDEVIRPDGILGTYA